MRFFTKNMAAAVAGAVALVAVSTASHATTVSIFSTGVDNSGNVQAGGSDIHYSSTGPTTLYAHPLYLPDDPAGGPGSAWIGSEDAFPDPAGFGTFDYTVHFTLGSVSEAILSGLWGTDNQGTDILINGQSTGISLLGVIASNFNQLHSFTTTLAQSALFVVGDNTLTFRVENDGGPGALRAANLSVATTPIPPSILMFLTALGGMGFVGYRRRAGSSAA